MRRYNNISLWENAHRLRMLYEFRNDVVSYFNAKQDSSNSDELNGIRSKINFSIVEASDLVLAANVNPTMTWRPPAGIGGIPVDINVITGMFNLEQFMIPSQIPVDFLERAHGVYLSNKTSSLLRTINPFWWFGQLIQVVAHIPFVTMRAAGLETAALEASMFGRLIKGLVAIITLVASVLGILRAVGWIDPIKGFFGG